MYISLTPWLHYFKSRFVFHFLSNPYMDNLRLNYNKIVTCTLQHVNSLLFEIETMNTDAPAARIALLSTRLSCQKTSSQSCLTSNTDCPIFDTLKYSIILKILYSSNFCVISSLNFLRMSLSFLYLVRFYPLTS